MSAGVSLVEMSQVGLLEVQKFQNLAVHVPKYENSFFGCFCVCLAWKTKCPRVIGLPMGDAHLSMSTPSAFCFKCSIRTHGVGKAQFSCHIEL